jgi:8-oxo-dGTP pyrophosphatase MutT (NUDIX family)
VRRNGGRVVAEALARSAMTLEPWSVEDSSRIVDDRWIRIRADSCRRSNGAAVDPYYVLENPEWVSIVAVTVSGDVILISEYHHGAGVVGIGLPGGTVDASDETPLAAARRELLEETGYVAADMISIGSAFANWANQTNRVHFFLASECVTVAPQSLDENEEIEISLVQLDDFSPMLLQQSFHLANALLAVEHLRSHDPSGLRSQRAAAR